MASIRTAGLALGAAVSVVAGWPLFAASPAPDVAGADYFEKHIRPVLVEHCYECHSAQAEKLKGGLRLDTRAGLLKGGETGPAILPGDPEKSLLLRAVRQVDDKLKMPAKGPKLSEQQIEDLAAWIKMGAPDPRTDLAESAKAKDSKATNPGAQHWAFQRVVEPPVPQVKNRRLVSTPVDNFILARLEQKGLTFSLRADRRTLIRRAAYDLTGLPPTMAEAEAFAADSSPDAFAHLVDRLLDSTAYGERWGRYWLDVARYADTKGYVFEEERRYAFSYTYRDWVIHALNEDLPYDQFLIQQIAADLLPLGEDKRPMAALGFLTLGRRFLNSQPDIIDDRIDVVMRGTMGLTVGCARCHDHKFDPIPTKDYYSLYGVFASTHEPSDKPLLGTAALPREYEAYVAEREKREKELSDFKSASEQQVLTKVRGQVGQYLLVVQDAERQGEDKREGVVRERKLQPSLVRQYKIAMKDWRKDPSPIFGPWFAFAELRGTNFAEAAAALCSAFPSWTPSNRVNDAVLALFQTNRPPASLKEAAERYDELFAGVDREWRESQTNSPGIQALPNPAREALREILYRPGSPIMALESDELRRFTDTPTQQKQRALRRKVDEVDATHPGAPPRAMALLDNSSPTEPVVFKRGNANNPGDKVPRQFLEVIAGPQRQPFHQGSGRLEMASAIASRDNPLTARVFVNRVWGYHFGAPFVRTPSDFGLRSDPPTHPELLDFLAARFMAQGWSIKKLHRLIMLSNAYQQSSDDNLKAEKIDPANQLIWRMNRRRLDFEATRDTLLAVGGRLDRRLGGRGVDLTTEPFTDRRTVYGFVERQNLPGLFRTFDFASPDTTSPQRFSTTVPQQALFLMNSPFVVQQARGLIARPEIAEVHEPAERIRRLYQLAFQREPDAAELGLARSFLESQAEPAEAEPPAWSYGYGKFDESLRRVSEFTSLPHWTGYAWQGGTNLPDPQLGWVILNAEGGHVGNDQNHAAIRRWRAPRDTMVDITGEVNHPSDKGDGVRVRIVSSEQGVLGEWAARHGSVPVHLERVTVKRGETLDFVADCRQTVEFDSFHWAPVLREVAASGRSGSATGACAEWNARADFRGPVKPAEKRALSAWEKYAQVLLLANEMAFVD